jgi:serine protease Do
MGWIEDAEASAAAALGAAGPAVVRIGRGPGRGAGFVLQEGVVVTNAHNLRGPGRRPRPGAGPGDTAEQNEWPPVTVTFADGRHETAAVAGVDAEGDLVALTVPTGAAPAIPWVPDGARAAVGRVVFALSLPGVGGVRLTSGTVSAVDRSFRGPRGRLIVDALEHTAPLARGSSGGPVVDGEGRLVGINTHRLGDGFYAALPATADLRGRLQGLARGVSPVRLRLGIALAPAGAARRLRSAVGLPERDGVLVRGVEEGGPAGSAGIAAGDLIVSAGGRAVAGFDDLLRALDAVGADRTLVVGIVRGVEEREVTVNFPTT